MKSPKFFQYLIVTVLLQSILLFAASRASAFGPIDNLGRLKTSPVDTQGLATKGPDNLTKPGQTPQLGGNAPPPKDQQWETVSGKTVADLYPAGSDPWFDKKNKIKKSDIKLPDGVISKASFEIMKALANKDETPYPVTGPSMGVSLMKAALLENALANEPQRAMHDAEIQGQAQTTQAGDAAADTARGQAASAISFCSSYLENFTTQAQWNMVRDQIFVPMALLLLLPGAVLAQARAIVAAGSPVLGEVNPFEGILRSIIAIFLIPATALVVNYGIDLNNSIAYTIQTEYNRIFGSDMYKDALCAEMRATPVRQSQSNRNALDQQTYQGKPLLGGKTPFAQFEGAMMENSIQDPCAGINQAPGAAANENMQSGMIATRMMMNGSNASLTAAWNILCAFQLAYLYYLWCVGPIMAALWVYPLRTLRNALPSWVEGVVTLCFWSLFWNTVILLIACFKGVDETGTMITTALNFLATASVKYAFDFAGLVKAAGQEAAGMAAGQAKNAASAGGGGGHGGAQRGHGGAAHGGRRSTGTLAGARNGNKEYAANSGARDGARKVAAEGPRDGGAVRDGGFGGMLIKASYEGPSMPSRSILESASAGRGFEGPKEGAGKKVATAAMDKVDAPPLVAKGNGVGDRLATIDSPIKMNPNEPGVHRDAQGKITGIDVADNDGAAAFGMFFAAQAKDEAARASATDGRLAEGIEGRDGQGFAGLNGAGLDGNDGAGVVLASASIGGANDVGLSSTDVLRTAEMGILGGAIPKDGVIHPLPEGAITGVAAQPNPDLAAKKALDLGLAGLNPDHDHAKPSAVAGLLLNGGVNGDLNIPANALVGMPPSSGYDAFGNPIGGDSVNVDLSRSSVDGSLVSFDSSQVSIDNSLTALDNNLVSVDNDLLALSSDDITNLSALNTTLDSTAIDASMAAGNVLSFDASTDNTFVDASQLTSAQLASAQLAALNNTDPASFVPNNGTITSFGRDGIDGLGGASAMPINGGMPINAGDTLVHYPQQIDASMVNASLINNSNASYSDISQNGAMRDLIQPAAGSVADTALSSTFAMFNRDNSVNTSAVEVWTPNQPFNGAGAPIDQTIMSGQGQGTPVSYEYSSGGMVNPTSIDATTNSATSMFNTSAGDSWTSNNASSMFNSTAMDWTSNNASQFSVDNGSYLTPTSAVQVQGAGDDQLVATPQNGSQNFERSIESGASIAPQVDNWNTSTLSQSYDSNSYASYASNNSSSVDGSNSYASYASNNSSSVDGSNSYASYPSNNSSSVDGSAYSNSSSFATYSSATIDNSAVVDNSQACTTSSSQYADNSQTYGSSTQAGSSTDISYSAPSVNYNDLSSSASTSSYNDATHHAPTTYNDASSSTTAYNDATYHAPTTYNDASSSTTAYNDATYHAPTTYNDASSSTTTYSDASYTAPSTTHQTEVSGSRDTADSARYAAYSTGGYAADANWTTNYSAPPTVEGDNNIAYNNSFGADQTNIPSRTTDSWFNGSSNSVSAAASPMIESPRSNEVIGHSDLGIAMPIIPKQVLASAEPAAPQPVAKAPTEAPRTLAMNTTKAVNTNRLTAAMGRAAGQSRNDLPAANNRSVVASNNTVGANGAIPARTACGAQPEYARYQPQAPNGNEPPPQLASMPDSLQNHLMLGNQRGGRLQKTDADEEATMKFRLDQMTGINGGTPV